jgi:hypothetical protein
MACQGMQAACRVGPDGRHVPQVLIFSGVFCLYRGPHYTKPAEERTRCIDVKSFHNVAYFRAILVDLTSWHSLGEFLLFRLFLSTLLRDSCLDVPSDWCTAFLLCNMVKCLISCIFVRVI